MKSGVRSSIFEDTRRREQLKDREYQKRRDKRKLREQTLLRDPRIRCYRFMFVPTVATGVGGCVATLLSTTRSLGEGTLFYTYRHAFYYIGPVSIAVGVVLLLLTVGLLETRSETVKKHIRETTPRSRTVSQRSSNSVCHSLDEMSDAFPPVDFTPKTSTVFSNIKPSVALPLGPSPSGPPPSRMVSFSDDVTICTIKKGSSQSSNCSIRCSESEKALRTSKSLSSIDADQSAECKPKQSLESLAGINFVIQRPSEESFFDGHDESTSFLPDKTKSVLKRQDAVDDTASEEEEIWIKMH